VRAWSLIASSCVLACSSSEDTTPAGSFTFFEAQVAYQRLDKVDVLFAIDDSRSMADKAVADQVSAIVSRLLSPRCVSESIYCVKDADCSPVGTSATCDRSRCVTGESTLGVCPDGLKPELAPVHDLHVGVVRSSLGCGDSGRLFGGSILHAKPVNGTGGGFLAWLPRSVPGNLYARAPNVTAYSDGEDAAFIADLRTLVSEVGTTGCGFESQLESWYRFLIQPDPYASIASGWGTQSLVGVDSTLLAMRHDFLRPDSLIVVVQITDEDDASIDPLAPSASFLRTVPQAPRSTSACDVDPSSAACSSCVLPGNASDPKCSQQTWYAPNQDGLDVRFGDLTKRRYGLDPQWSVDRYVHGMRDARVADRDGNQCINPLYARDLPDGSDTTSGALCNLQEGPRTPDLVFYSLIAGVAPSLVVDANGDFKLGLSPDDWAKLIGPNRDAHMIESIAPRPSLLLPSQTYDLGTDPQSGREWNTTNGIGDLGTSVDFQFACTFDLPKPRDCTIESACDCAPGSPGATAPDGPPLCDPNARTMQVRGKAYPSTRLLEVAKGLGAQATVNSICASWLPALTSLSYRLEPFNDWRCFPEILSPHDDCTVDCRMLIVYPGETNQSAGCTDPGTSQPDAVTLGYFANEFLASLGDGGASVPVPVMCNYRQLTCADWVGPSCEPSPNPGWCYVSKDPNTSCHAIDFSADGPPPGTTLSVYCIQH
jgi:hypothetical protein